MEKEGLAEQRLYKAIHAVIEWSDGLYEPDLGENEQIGRSKSNKALAKGIADQIIREIECRKESERMMHRYLIDERHKMTVEISTRPISYSLTRG